MIISFNVEFNKKKLIFYWIDVLGVLRSKLI